MPAVSAEAAILFDATHNTVLFEKNADEKLYPGQHHKADDGSSVLEKADLNDTVVFSKTAVTNLESGAVTLNLQEGDRVSVRDCLYGLLLKSANEVANGLAEHVGGSIQGFADLMNQRAAELGCTGTHFTNPSGLNDPDHYTTARDMAKIAGAAFKNETLQKISSSLSYEFPATKAAAARTITPGHKMLYPSDSRYYEGIVGGKTGYTSLGREYPGNVYRKGRSPADRCGIKGQKHPLRGYESHAGLWLQKASGIRQRPVPSVGARTETAGISARLTDSSLRGAGRSSTERNMALTMLEKCRRAGRSTERTGTISVQTALW